MAGRDFDFDLDDDDGSGTEKSLSVSIRGTDDDTPKSVRVKGLGELRDGVDWQPFQSHLSVRALEIADQRWTFLVTLTDGSTHHVTLKDVDTPKEISLPDGRIARFAVENVACLTEEESRFLRECFRRSKEQER